MENNNNEQISSQLKDLFERVDIATKSKVVDTDQIMSPSIGKLGSALAKAQGEFMVAGKSSANPFFKSKYADLTSIVNATRPALVKYDLSVAQDVFHMSDGNDYLITLLIHGESDQWLKSKAKIAPQKSDIQSLSSYNTYLQRICYGSLVGAMTGDEDDDGNAGSAQPTYAREIAKLDFDQQVIVRKKLDGFPALADRMLKGYNVTNVADLPKEQFAFMIDRIDSIKRQEYPEAIQ